MLVESGNPAHSLADSARMREAIAALDLVVVIDVAFTETARLAHYVLPVASQFEKAEATFFNFEFPHNYFHLRRALMRPLPGLFSEAELHARLVEALGALPADAVAALRAAWREGRRAFRAKFFELVGANPRAARRRAGPALPRDRRPAARRVSRRAPASGRCARSRRSGSPRRSARAGFAGEPGDAGDALFDALLAEQERGGLRGRRLGGELRARAHAEPAHPARDPGALRRARRARRRSRRPARSASSRSCSRPASGARSPPTRSSATRSGGGRTAPARCACSPDDAQRLGVADGGACGSRRGAAAPRSSSRSPTACSPGHVSLPNGLGLDFPDASGAAVATGVAPNELTRGEDRDWLAGTPWHKHTPARVEAL